MAAAEVAASQRDTAGGGESQLGSAMVSKWAPDVFDGTQEAWRSWNLKFRSYVGAMNKGQVGVWMDYVAANRDTSAKRAALDPKAQPSSSLLYGSLIATCDGKSLTIVERAGEGEGLEAWRLLLGKYDVQTRQTRVIRMIQILQWEFKSGDLLDRLEALDLAVSKYESAAGKVIDDDTKIGIVIKGMEAGALREHMRSHSERCVTCEEFRGRGG